VESRVVKIGGQREPEKIRSVVECARDEGDSVGGVALVKVEGLPPGVGGPLFGGLESRISQAVFAIPAVKGIEFGDGFAVADMKGSENNDPYTVENGKVVPLTNHAGGILGGISTGAPLVFRAAFKPTPSIAKEQNSVDMNTMQQVKLSVKGRHDPCVVFRALPCLEAAAAIAVYDAMLERRKELP
jgi:chorismate synthase